MSPVLDVVLPFPPSVNTYYRHPTKGRLAGRHLISEAGREYRAAVCKAIGWRDLPITEPLRVEIEAFMPDRRRRDLDNLLKATLDSLTHAGIWADDCQIHHLSITRALQLGGSVRVVVHRW